MESPSPSPEVLLSGGSGFPLVCHFYRQRAQSSESVGKGDHVCSLMFAAWPKTKPSSVCFLLQCRRWGGVFPEALKEKQMLFCYRDEPPGGGTGLGALRTPHTIRSEAPISSDKAAQGPVWLPSTPRHPDPSSPQGQPLGQMGASSLWSQLRLRLLTQAPHEAPWS